MNRNIILMLAGAAIGLVVGNLITSWQSSKAISASALFDAASYGEILASGALAGDTHSNIRKHAEVRFLASTLVATRYPPKAEVLEASQIEAICRLKLSIESKKIGVIGEHANVWAPVSKGLPRLFDRIPDAALNEALFPACAANHSLQARRP